LLNELSCDPASRSSPPFEFTETPFTGHVGEHVRMPPRNVVPKPVQRPHPPVWVACSRRETIHLAAQQGIGALAFAFFDPEEARHWVDDYYATLASEGVPIGDAVNANVACVTSFFCHAGNVAWRTGRKLTVDAESETFVGDGASEANALRTRPVYRKPWVLPDVS